MWMVNLIHKRYLFLFDLRRGLWRSNPYDLRGYPVVDAMPLAPFGNSSNPTSRR